jgi:hypothetical protein
MAAASTFVWRIRLCLVLFSAGQVFVEDVNQGGLQRKNIPNNVQQVKCQVQRSRASNAQQAAQREAGLSRSAAPCSQPADKAAPARPQNFRPGTVSASANALSSAMSSGISVMSGPR